MRETETVEDIPAPSRDVSGTAQTTSAGERTHDQPLAKIVWRD